MRELYYIVHIIYPLYYQKCDNILFRITLQCYLQKWYINANLKLIDGLKTSFASKKFILLVTEEIKKTTE